jgi:hypothetical protein
MAHTCKRCPGGGGAAAVSTGWRGPQHSNHLPRTEDPDPIRRLLDLLDTALARQGAITLPDGQTVLVRPVAEGCYAVERRP